LTLPAEIESRTIIASTADENTSQTGLTTDEFLAGGARRLTLTTILGTSVTALQASTRLVTTELLNRTVAEFLTGWLRAAFLGLLAVRLLRNACIRLNLRLRTGTTRVTLMLLEVCSHCRISNAKVLGILWIARRKVTDS
jgi:hypothetical protein